MRGGGGWSGGGGGGGGVINTAELIKNDQVDKCCAVLILVLMLWQRLNMRGYSNYVCAGEGELYELVRGKLYVMVRGIYILQYIER